MATLTEAELARLKAELGDHVLDAGAEPYLGYRSVYEVVRQYVVSDDTAATTCATPVTAAGAATLTLGSVAGVTAGATRLVLDVDEARETCTVRAVSGSTVSVICKKVHAAGYPVEIESPLTLVRGLLETLTRLDQVTTLDALGSLGLKKVDEVEFFGRTEGGGTVFEQIQAARDTLRRDLARACGLGWLLAGRSGGGALAVY